jgi:hypothetical protein
MRERGEVDESMARLRRLAYFIPKTAPSGIVDPVRRRQGPHGDQERRRADLLCRRYCLSSNKFERKFAKLINVWGADHHGYVPRLKAAMQGLGYDANRLHVVLVQMVQSRRAAGEPVRMGKRTGEFVALEEVLEEVGADAARFFFLMRKSDSHLDFDLELAKKQSSENPVFYVQYAMRGWRAF